ncbi:TetR/AcrR family transcriptional regulator [Pseudomonas sp. MSSRFD41]|uniref:TetR/AcrR family transcriptional regulator n=1 Tax=Pseudomonas sp. MSSRFD41 TaxID=1310370 RepID=UPI001639A21F|nr:TetR/AcrR family transcriptional regulator [Pseudomonas sp. MSSRFD41]MBC2659086.1 TetR/AcrR family transcriptional regulator [Pseudomonas sp. MSSRFD41]
MARTRNEQLHEQRREQILLAATRVFKKKGFHGARTEDICQQADMSAGAVFRYFSDKREIIDGVIAKECERYLCQAQQLFSKDGLHRLASISAEELTQELNPGEFDLSLDSWLEITRSHGQIKLIDLEQQMRKQLSELLAHGQLEGWVRSGLSPQGSASLLFSLLSGIWLEMNLGLGTDTDQAAAALGDFVRTYIFAPEFQRRFGSW